MELTELNQHLARLSEHEKGYRDGTLVHNWGKGPWGINEGPVKDSIILSEGKRLYIRRNSRFSPMPEHTHNTLEISYEYTGVCRQTVNGKPLRLAENQVLLLDSGSRHSIEAQGEGDIMLSIMMPQDFLAQCLMNAGTPESAVSRFLVNALASEANHESYILFDSRNNRRIRRYFQELMCEYLDPTPAAEQVMLSLVRLILMELINVYEADYTRKQEASNRVSVVPIIRYIEQNFQTCTQQSVAEHFFISPNYVSKLLKRHTGMTYIQAVQAQRLAHAATLLRTTNRPIDDIARECGYENQSFFYKKFAERYQKSPGAYRGQK